MVILSPSPSTFSAATTSSFFSLSRVSPPHLPLPLPLPLPFPFSFPSLKFFSLSARFASPKSASPSPLHSLKTRAMAELVKDEESTHTGVAAVLSSSDGRNELGHSRTFLDARSEDELLLGIKTESEAERLPLSVASGMEELYYNYKNAVFESGVPRADEIVLSNMAVALDRILLEVEDPFVFSPCHKAIREPFDYFMFGQNYIRPLIDFRNSFIGNIGLFHEMENQLTKGDNIVLISNHQTEADPAVIALLLEKACPHIVERMAYVAGDRVVTDPLSKPFSMGRNLICVYSKKHMFDVPELAEMKRKANIRSLKEMSLLFRSGSQIVWIAPSGGRDRPNPSTGEWYPAPFDPSSVDNMRRLAEHSGVPSHIYPLALLCHDIMPPPPQVEKEIGEKRVIRFSGAGLSVAPEISFSAIASACKNPEEAKVAYSRELYGSVTEQYDVLKSAIYGRKGVEASIPNVSLTQP